MLKTHTLAILILFLGLSVLFFPDLIVGGRTLYWTDLSWIHYPRHYFAASEWLAGRVPLWDPYQDTGQPLLAETQVGVLYPFSLIFLSALSPALELSLFILLHFSLAAIFTFILARSLTLPPLAATLAGLSYGFGGFLMAQVPNLNIMTGAVWLPLVLWAVIRALRRRTILSAMLAGMPITLQILTAQPQIVFYTLVTVAGYGVYRLGADVINSTESRLKHSGWTVVLLGVGVATGILLAAPQLLPTYELQQLSIRADARDFNFLTDTSLRPIMLLNLLLPSLFGNNVTGFRGGDPFQEVFIYVGLIPLILVAFSGAQRRQKDMPFFWLLLIAGMLLALGRFTPLYAWVIQYLPGFSLFRIPARWLMVVNLALAMLAGYGLQTILTRGVSRRAWMAITATGISLAAVVGWLWLFSDEVRAWSQGLPAFHQRLTVAFLDRGFRSWLSPVPVFLVDVGMVLLLFGALARRYITVERFAVLVILVAALDLAAAGGTTINPTRPSAWWTELSGGAEYVLENLDEGRVFPLGMGSEEATVSHLGQYFPSVYEIRSAGGHGSSLRIARYDTFLHEVDPVQAVQVIGARYLLTLGQMGADVAATYPLAYSDADSYVYENRDFLPRAFVVHHAIHVETPADALTHFQIREVNPRETVVLEHPTETPLLNSAPGHTPVTITAEHPQRIEIRAHVESPGYLVLLDTYYPGWYATVNGQPTPIYRANYIGRAVYLPAGGHVVRFEYWPASFWGGAVMSLVVMVVLGGVVVGHTINLRT